MTVPNWSPPNSAMPSIDYRGEDSVEKIYFSVGRACSHWEHSEVILGRLFQFFCETPSFVASQVYGTPLNFRGRLEIVEMAIQEFFLRRKEDVQNLEFKATAASLLRAFSQASTERNRIVHAMVAGIFRKGTSESLGYYLQPSYYSTRKRGAGLDADWPYDADYYYRAAEIEHCAARFEALLTHGMNLWTQLRDHFGEPADTEFSPRTRLPERK